MGIKSIALFTAALFLSTGVNAAVISFNGTAPEATAVLASNTNYTEAGYDLAIGGQSTYFIDNNYRDWPGLTSFDDDALLFNSHKESFTVTKSDSGLFDLISVETGTLGRRTSDDGNFIFTGTFAAGGTISNTISAIGPLVTTNIFSGFTGLTSLTVTTTDGLFPVLDNLTVIETSEVPVPAAVWLFGSGLLCLIGIARRKQV